MLCTEESISHLSLKQTLSIPIRTMSFIKDSQPFSAALVETSATVAAVADAYTYTSILCTVCVYKYIYIYLYYIHRRRVYTTRASVKMRSMSSALVHHLLCSRRTDRLRDDSIPLPSLSLSFSIFLSIYLHLSISSRQTL